MHKTLTFLWGLEDSMVNSLFPKFFSLNVGFQAQTHYMLLLVEDTCHNRKVQLKFKLIRIMEKIKSWIV